MSPLAAGIGFALVSSFATAVAHALLKVGRDRLAVRAAIGMTCAALASPGLLVAPLPTSEVFAWLVASTAIHTVYTLVLIVSYEASDFSVAFPLARGIAPLSSAILGVALLGDLLSPAVLTGILVVTAGIFGLTLGARLTGVGLLAAMCAGLLTTAYTVVDARGMRASSDALTFLSWFFLLEGIAIFSIFAVARRGSVVRLLRSEGRRGILAGAVATVSYGSALMALRLAPVGVASALRETSVVFGIVIAGTFLGERVGRRRVICALIVASGAMLILAD